MITMITSTIRQMSRRQWQKATNDVATNPAFTSVSEVSGTAGAFALPEVSWLIQLKTLPLWSSGWTDFVYIVSGTGVTLNTNDYHYAIIQSTTTNQTTP